MIKLKSKVIPNHNNYLITKTKILTYIIFTLIFIATSYLSVLFIQKHFGDKTVFFSFEFLSPAVLLKLVILLIFYFLLDALRFLYILKTLQIPVNIGYVIKLTFINIFISNITPFATGGGFSQIYFLNKKHVSIGDATAATTIKAVLPLIFFFITTPIILISNKTIFKIIPSSNNLISILVLVFIYFLVAYGIYKILINTNIIKKNLSKILTLLQNKIVISKNKVEKFKNIVFLEIDIFALKIKKFLNGNKKYIILSI
ncbi:MAG: flippase-like domain-containing protein, partial [Clostridiaceae bacterium]|nr:flippase-like domain-containing protein [Clostridiaceae bacterium]